MAFEINEQLEDDYRKARQAERDAADAFIKRHNASLLTEKVYRGVTYSLTQYGAIKVTGLLGSKKPLPSLLADNLYMGHAALFRDIDKLIGQGHITEVVDD